MSSSVSPDTQPFSDSPRPELDTREQYSKFLDVLYYKYASFDCVTLCDPDLSRAEKINIILEIRSRRADRLAWLGLPFCKAYAFPDSQDFNEGKALSEFQQNFTPERINLCLEQEEAFFNHLKALCWGEEDEPFPPECIRTRLGPDKKGETQQPDLTRDNLPRPAPGGATEEQYNQLDSIFSLYDELTDRIRLLDPEGKIDQETQVLLDAAEEDKRSRFEGIGLSLIRAPQDENIWDEFNRLSAKYSKEQASELVDQADSAIRTWEKELGLKSTYGNQKGMRPFQKMHVCSHEMCSPETQTKQKE